MKGGFSLPVCVARSFLVWVAYNVFRIPYLTTGDFWAPLATFAINELIDICRRGLAMELLAHVKPSFLTEVRSSPLGDHKKWGIIASHYLLAHHPFASPMSY